MQNRDGRFGTDGQDVKFQYLKAISHPMRRRVLDVLQIEPGSLGLQRLTHSISDATQSPDSNKVEKIRIALYHQHLPHLADAGLVEFDEQQNRVEITEKALRKLR